jgi:DNA replication protein DnaC
LTVQKARAVLKFGIADERAAECETHGAFAQQLMRFKGQERWLDCPKCVEERQAKEDEEHRKNLVRENHERSMQSLMNKAAIPPRFQNRTLDNYCADLPEKKSALAAANDYADRFAEALKTGSSLILCGLPGTGKTHLAIGVAHKIIGVGRTAVFTSAMNAIRRVRETYRKESSETERDAISSFAKPDLVIIDEVGQQLGTDAEKVTLFDIINARYEAMRPMIVISNLDLNGIREYLGERAFDRLREGGGRAVQFTWPSHRREA